MDIQLEITLMENRLTTMENKLNDVESKLDALDGKMSQVIDAIIGNKLTKSNGLADDIREIGELADKHEEILKKTKWLWIGVVSVSTVIGFILKIVLEFFAK
jgi:glutamate/tyrosine decarboxylase-like PLP-dependent enzyme